MRSEQLIRALALIGATAVCGVGCVAHASAGGSMEAEAPVVFVEPPTLVEVDADVWVVRDYDYSVYYTGGFYWVYRDGIWWRSEMYDKGWAKVEVSVVPQVIVQRDHHAYVHYKGSATAKTKIAPRDRLASDTEPRQGPPGHDEIPGVGNQRKAEEGNPGLGNKKEEPPGQIKKEEAKVEKAEKKEEKAEKKEEKAEKKEEKKEQKKEEKKGGPGGPKKK